VSGAIWLCYVALEAHLCLLQPGKHGSGPDPVDQLIVLAGQLLRHFPAPVCRSQTHGRSDVSFVLLMVNCRLDAAYRLVTGNVTALVDFAVLHYRFVSEKGSVLAV
jgi:hypothetical protein